MKFTGERYIPESCGADLAYEHWHRYLYARKFIAGKDVLDIASGSGYGTALMAETARSVLGVDISKEAVDYCKAAYIRDNLTFREGSVVKIPADDASFDVVVCFETLEHVSGQEQKSFLDEIRRVLRPDGLLVISTPNAAVYQQRYGNGKNEFHVNELSIDGFKALMHDNFECVRLVGQRQFVGSYIFSLTGKPGEVETTGIRWTPDGIRPADNAPTSVYLIAVCSHKPLPEPVYSVSVDEAEIRIDQIRSENAEREAQLRAALAAQQKAAADREAQLKEMLGKREIDRFERLAKRQLEIESLLNERFQCVHDMLLDLAGAEAGMDWFRAKWRKAPGAACSGNPFRCGWTQSIRSGWEWIRKRLGKSAENRSQIVQTADGIAREDESERLKKFERLGIPRCRKPTVSIVIPTHNQFAYVYCCIRSVIANTWDVPYEIIIADDCSTDETVNAARHIRNVRVVRTESNVRFLRNCNNAAKAARGKYLLFLNNDTLVHQNWLKPLVDICERDARIGVTGSKLVYSDGTLQEAGGIMWRDGTAWNYGRNREPFDSEYCYVKECDYISGASLMVRKTLWDEVGGFDDRFAPAYYEDTDLCFEARKRGYKVVFQPASIVTHFEGRSNGTFEAEGLKRYQAVNRQKFLEKWKETLENHPPNAEDVFTSRDRSARKRHVFLVDHYVPTFDRDAGGRQIYFYLKTLVEMGFQVHLMSDNCTHEEPYASTFQQMGIEVLYGGRFNPSNREEWLRENGKHLDFAFLHRPHIAVNYLDMVRANTGAKVIFFGADVGQVRIKREFDVKLDPKLMDELAVVKKQEDFLYGASDVNLCVGSADADFVRSHYPSRPVFDIPLFIYDHFNESAPGFKARRDIMFVGGFNHHPNVDAVQWFVREIFPKILKACPRVRFRVVGSQVPDEIAGLASKSVVIEGFLSDERLQALYGQCRLTVAPVRFGAGVKGKVVDAMYFRSVVVTTTIGAEGIPQDPRPFAVADDAEAFAREVIRLYTDEAVWTRYHEDSLKLIKKTYSLDSARKILEKVFVKD